MRCVLELTSCTQSWPICTHGGAEAASSSTPVAPPTMSVMQAAAYNLCTEESQPKVLLAVPNDDAHLRDGYEGEHVMSRDEP